MPFTPFHFGPGIFVKSLLNKQFSFRMFILANVVTDLEPLYYIMTDQYPLHRFFHTYVGASASAVLCIAIGRPVCSRATELWNNIFKFLPISNERITNSALVISAFAGTYSHILLDSLMHRDMAPFYPFNASNNLLQLVTYEYLHLFCILLAVAGVTIYFANKGKK